jgi:hypothetical protein
MTYKKLFILSLALLIINNIYGQDLYQKANAFLNSLSPEIRSKAYFTMNDPERYNIQFVPISRKGASFHDFNDEQKELALELLRASLSNEGYRKSTQIIELEKVLIVVENNKNKMPDGSPMRDPLKYYLCIFGDPSNNNFWGWRFEGHHLSLSFTSNDNQIVSSTPSFFGSNPAIVDVKGFDHQEVLKLETDLGFKLVNSLNEEQLAIARFSDTAPREIITRNNKTAENIEPRGISFNQFEGTQKEIFLDLLNVYIDNYEVDYKETLRERIQLAGVENLTFAWAGSLDPGAGHYYRIQGPMLLIEYDNTQNNANHVHSVVRDLSNDFAEDLLKAHYQNDH